jgi:hypothetical protein
MKDVNFNDLAKKAYENAKAKGFHDVEHEDGHLFMLVVCELAEAVEADRSDRWADRQEYERLMGMCEDVVKPHLFEMYIKDTVEDELADAVIRLLDFSGMKGFDIDSRLGKVDFAEYEENDGKMMSFAGKVYDIVSMLCFDEYVEYTMGDIFRLAYRRGIDLMWFVKEKMMYNETRELLHGKLY